MSISLPTYASAATSGSLDSSFGNGGIQTTKFNAPYSGIGGGAHSLAIDKLGRIIAGGGSQSTFNLARYTDAGVLDTTFGKNGMVATPIPGFPRGYMASGAISSIALAKDGKIIAGGASGNFNKEGFTLARYTTTGQLDRTFGNHGFVVTSFENVKFHGYDFIASLAIDTLGRIIAGGYSGIPWNSGNPQKFTLARYLPSGALDSTFGSRGIVKLTIGIVSRVNAIAIDKSGKIVAGGISGMSRNNSVFTIARFDSTGHLDSTFGNNGVQTTSIGSSTGSDNSVTSYANLNSIAIDNSGAIIAGGEAAGHFALARYTPSGALDSTFGTNGVQITQIAGNSSIFSIGIDHGGNILAGGQSSLMGNGITQFTVARYSPAGMLDNSFGSGGIETTTIGDTSLILSIVIDSAGNIDASGGTNGIDTSSNFNFALVRYLA